MELAQFQNSAPEYLTLSEDFWRALSSLPITYDYSAYRKMFETYGTHYFSEGSLGGQYQALLEMNQNALSSTSKTISCNLSNMKTQKILNWTYLKAEWIRSIFLKKRKSVELCVQRYNRHWVSEVLAQGEAAFILEEGQNRLWKTYQLYSRDSWWVKGEVHVAWVKQSLLSYATTDLLSLNVFGQQERKIKICQSKWTFWEEIQV